MAGTGITDIARLGARAARGASAQLCSALPPLQLLDPLDAGPCSRFVAAAGVAVNDLGELVPHGLR